MNDTVKQVPVDEATGPQLRKFAAEHLGMEFDQFEKVETIRAQVKQAWNKEAIPVAESGSAPPPAKPAAKAKAVPDDENGEVIVYIQTTDAFDGEEDVSLGCNGRVIRVPRGEWCAIPRKFLDSLRNAVQNRYEPVKEGGMSQARPVQLYPYQVWTGPGEPAEGVRRPPEKAAA